MSIPRKSIFWIHILTGAFLQVRLELSNFDLLILVTGFDLIVPVLTVFALSAGWAKWPTNSFLFAICLVLAGLVTHSAVIYFLSDSVELGTLIKETLKLGTLVFLFASMVVLFSDKNFRLASDQLVTGCLVVFSIPIVLISIFEPFYIARTSQAVGLLSMVFLLSCSKDWLADRRRRLLLCALACGVCLICFLLKSKATAGAAAVFAIWFAMAPLFADRRGNILWTFGLLILAVGSAATLIFFLADGITERFFHIDSVARSIDVRMRLWGVTLTALVENFPLGTGVGQLSSILTEAKPLAGENHRFPHNSVLGLGAELGALGAVMIGTIAWCIYCGLKHWRWHTGLLFLALLGPAFSFHDGHSVRMLVVVLALGVAGYLCSRSDPITDRNGGDVDD